MICYTNNTVIISAGLLRRKTRLARTSGEWCLSSLFRMRQFYETYHQDEKVSPVVRQLPWAHNLLILSHSKRPEEREFYLTMASQGKWSKRELERQLKTGLFERAVLSPPKVSPLVTQIHPEALNIFKDSYLVDFLNLSEEYNQAGFYQELS